MEKRDGKKLGKIIGFSKNGTCEIILPVWEGNIEYSQKEANFAKKNYGKNLDQLAYYRKDEAELLLLIQQMNEMAGFNKSFLLKDPNATDLKVGNDKIICGGPLSNIYLKHIFSGEDTSQFTFKKKFYFGSKPYWTFREKNQAYSDIEKEIPSDAKGKIFFIEKSDENLEKISVPESYMVFIKQSFKKRGSFFICFGDSGLTTNKAFRCLIDNVDIMYNIFKKHKNQFFIILECSKNGDVNFDSKHIIDLTDEMF